MEEVIIPERAPGSPLGAAAVEAAQAEVFTEEQLKEVGTVANFSAMDLAIPEEERLEEVNTGLTGAMDSSHECQLPRGDSQPLEQVESESGCADQVQNKDDSLGSQADGGQQGAPLADPVVANGQKYFQVSLSDGISMQIVPRPSSSSLLDDAISGWSGSASSVGEPLVSLHGPDEEFRGRIMGLEERAAVALQEEASLSKMRRFCASILKKLAPPLLKEIESSIVARSQVVTTPPRRITRATGATPAPRASKKVSAAESMLLKALGISQAELEVSDAAIQDFRDLFDSPVREQHLRAMAAIFGKTMPESFDNREAKVGTVLVQ
jgi:hypothetical protein